MLINSTQGHRRILNYWTVALLQLGCRSSFYIVRPDTSRNRSLLSLSIKTKVPIAIVYTLLDANQHHLALCVIYLFLYTFFSSISTYSAFTQIRVLRACPNTITHIPLVLNTFGGWLINVISHFVPKLYCSWAKDEFLTDFLIVKQN